VNFFANGKTVIRYIARAFSRFEKQLFIQEMKLMSVSFITADVSGSTFLAFPPIVKSVKPADDFGAANGWLTYY
jgi:hypothetical protein